MLNAIQCILQMFQTESIIRTPLTEIYVDLETNCVQQYANVVGKGDTKPCLYKWVYKCLQPIKYIL